jgi:hypothetical protein
MRINPPSATRSNDKDKDAGCATTDPGIVVAVRSHASSSPDMQTKRRGELRIDFSRPALEDRRREKRHARYIAERIHRRPYQTQSFHRQQPSLARPVTNG